MISKNLRATFFVQISRKGTNFLEIKSRNRLKLVTFIDKDVFKKGKEKQQMLRTGLYITLSYAKPLLKHKVTISTKNIHQS